MMADDGETESWRLVWLQAYSIVYASLVISTFGKYNYNDADDDETEAWRLVCHIVW